MLRIGWWVGMMAAAFTVVLLADGVVLAEDPVVKGTVVAACPMGGMLMVKGADGKEVTFGVVEKARGQVKVLKAGDQVEVTYTQCPKTKKLTVTAVKKL